MKFEIYYNKYKEIYGNMPKSELVDLLARADASYVMKMKRRNRMTCKVIYHGITCTCTCEEEE